MDSSKRSSNFSSKIITILDSANKVAFEAHEEVLTKILYFQKCLTGQFVEATRKEILLPEDDPAAFEQVLEYAYQGRFSIKLPAPVGPGLRSLEVAHISILTVNAYIYSPISSIERLTNSLINHCWKIRQTYQVTGSQLQLLSPKGPEDGKMRQYALQHLAFAAKFHGFVAFKGLYPEVFENFLDLSAENSQALMEKILVLPIGDKSPAYQMNGCTWHTHIITPKCAEINQTDVVSAHKRRPIDLTAG